MLTVIRNTRLLCFFLIIVKLKKLSSWYKSCGEEFEKFADNLRLVMLVGLTLDSLSCSWKAPLLLHRWELGGGAPAPTLGRVGIYKNM